MERISLWMGANVVFRAGEILGHMDDLFQKDYLGFKVYLSLI